MVDILKINAEEARILANLTDDDSIVDCANIILGRFSVKILAITDGSSGAYLFDKTKPSICICTVYTLPKLTTELLDLEPHSPINSFQSSLPEATGESFQPRMQSSTNLASLLSMREEKLILNPLGAGDTCSAIFLLEYLDTRVNFCN